MFDKVTQTSDFDSLRFRIFVERRSVLLRMLVKRFREVLV